MNRQFETAWRLHEFLTTRRIPYMIIGSIAVQRWGQPRLTRDVDLTLVLPPGGEEPVLREIVATFPPRIEDAVAFALAHRPLPVEVPGGSEGDLSLGLPGYEEQAVEGVVARQGKVLDVGYIRRWLGELAGVAEDPEVLARFERCLRAVGSGG